MGRYFVSLLVLGLISLACSGAGTPTLTECPKHTTCVAEDLGECMCDENGALFTAEGFCSVSFDPPCPASQKCTPVKGEDCADHGDGAGEETGFIPG